MLAETKTMQRTCLVLGDDDFRGLAPDLVLPSGLAELLPLNVSFPVDVYHGNASNKNEHSKRLAQGSRMTD